MKKTLFWSVIIPLALYIAVAFNIYMNQRKIMYDVITAKNIPENFGITKEFERIRVKTSDFIDLEGWYIPSRNGKIIVAFHGNGQNIASTFGGISKLTEDGYGLLMVEYRGYAGHKSEFTEEGAYKDGRAFVNWLQVSKNIPYENMILYGESMGSAVAFQMASEFDTAAVIVLGSFISIVSLGQDIYWFLPVHLLLYDQYDVGEIIQNVDEPKLFIHGTGDKIIPISYAKSLFAISPEPKEFFEVKDAKHADLYNYGIEKKIALFLEEHVQEKSD